MPRFVAEGDEQWAMDSDHADEIAWILEHPDGDDSCFAFPEEIPEMFAAGQRGFRILWVGPKWAIDQRSAGRRSLADGDPLTSVRR